MATVSSSIASQNTPSMPELAVPQLNSSQPAISPWDKLRESVSDPPTANQSMPGLGMQILGFRTQKPSVPVTSVPTSLEPQPLPMAMKKLPQISAAPGNELPSANREWMSATHELTGISPAVVTPTVQPHARLGNATTIKPNFNNSTSYPTTDNRSLSNAVQEVSFSQHTIRDGDSLYSLAQRYLGDGQREMELYAENRHVLQNPQILPIGITLRIPNLPTSARTVPQTANPASSPPRPVGQLVPISPDAWK